MRKLSHILYRSLDRLLDKLLTKPRIESGFSVSSDEKPGCLFVVQGGEVSRTVPDRCATTCVGIFLILSVGYFAAIAVLHPSSRVETDEMVPVIYRSEDAPAFQSISETIEAKCSVQDFAGALELAFSTTATDHSVNVGPILQRWNESQQIPTSESIKLIERLAIEGDSNARNLVIRACRGQSRLPGQLELAAEAGHLDSMMALAIRESAKGNFDHAANWFFQGAMLGSVEAMYQFGLCCLDGKGISVAEEQAIRFLDLAASHQHAKAMTLLGICYRDGRGVVAEPTLAVEWFESASLAGDAEGWKHLGDCFQEGFGVAKNLEVAAKSYLAGAEAGCFQSMNAYAKCALSGVGMEADRETAGYWFQKAAQGNVEEAVAWCQRQGAANLEDRKL